MSINPEKIAAMRKNWEDLAAEIEAQPGYAEAAETFDREYEVAVALDAARLTPKARKPTHPGAILKELFLEELHVGISEFADHIGISRKTISGIINGHRGVTPEMAIRFAKALPHTSAEMWLNLQKAYDQRVVMRKL